MGTLKIDNLPRETSLTYLLETIQGISKDLEARGAAASTAVAAVRQLPHAERNDLPPSPGRPLCSQVVSQDRELGSVVLPQLVKVDGHIEVLWTGLISGEGGRTERGCCCALAWSGS